MKNSPSNFSYFKNKKKNYVGPIDRAEKKTRRKKIKPNSKLKFKISPQPNETTCGPSCLYSIYRFLGDHISLNKVIEEIYQFEEGGGTLGVILGNHALLRDFKATLYTINLKVMDPTWADLPMPSIKKKLEYRLLHRQLKKERMALEQYIKFLDLGGSIRIREMTSRLISNYLSKGTPILCGLSSTWLYQTKRELPDKNIEDDVLGEPEGHFVVLYGYNAKTKMVNIGDPYYGNPFSNKLYYKAHIRKVLTAIYLGVLTFDGNILVLEKKSGNSA